jgi:hypothetical protein
VGSRHWSDNDADQDERCLDDAGGDEADRGTAADAPGNGVVQNGGVTPEAAVEAGRSDSVSAVSCLGPHWRVLT